VEILSEKDEPTYRKILGKHGIDPREFVMVGNSLRSDVLPVAALGGTGIFVPYHLTWEHEREGEERAAETPGVFTVERIDEVPAVLERLEAGG
jgi:putative hydrolase of the HAD superfamily